MLNYQGKISGSDVSRILDQVEEQFAQMHTSAQVKRKLLNVLIESVQNVFHHSSSQPNPLPGLHPSEEPTVMVVEQQRQYVVVTGNRIPKEKALALAARIERINLMSREELNQTYRNTLITRAKTSTTGAGVGIIDIARRSGSPIEFTLQEVDDHNMYLRMEVKVQR